MTAYVMLEGDGWGIGFGGYTLDQWSDVERRRVGTDYGMEFIAAVLQTVDVSYWEQLVGKHVRVELEGLGSIARRIGHITKDRWFDPKALADKMCAKVVA